MNSLKRRDFLKTAGLGTAAAIGTGLFPADIQAEIDAMDPLIINKIETVSFKKGHWSWVRLHTKQGIMGIGETYPMTNSQNGAIRDRARHVIGKDARNIERIWRDLYGRASFQVTGGAEMRAISAINIAQYDLLGKALGVPIYRLLGGKAREKIKVYNTTFGIHDGTRQLMNEQDIEKVCQFLYDRGVKAMKIWPYDPTARRNNESYISPAELDRNLDWVRRIRNTLGDEMEICVEFHCHWNLPCALRIAKSLEPYNIMWIEDILLPDNPQAYAVLSRETSIPCTVSERLATRFQFRELLEANAVDIVMYDTTWCGGITSAKKISDYADTYYVPTAPHTYGGPILWYSSMHVSAALTNLWIMESGYNFYHDLYPDYLNYVHIPVDGFVEPPEGPGLGMDIKEDIYRSGEATVETVVEL